VLLSGALLHCILVHFWFALDINTHLAYKIGNSDVKSEEDYDSKFMFQLGYIF
jgi:hypothetical protein